MRPAKRGEELRQMLIDYGRYLDVLKRRQVECEEKIKQSSVDAGAERGGAKPSAAQSRVRAVAAA